MRHSKPILLSTLSVLALLAGTTVAQAFVPPPTVNLGVLKPQSKWKVSTINAQNTSYCAMVNQFDNQVSLAFARSSEGYGSIAIDFNRNFFKPGEDYGVSLQVDDTGMHNFVARASGERSVIVQIGLDDHFYNALSGDGNLRIWLPSMDMTFALNKFSESYISLVDCAAKLQPQQSGPRTVAMPVPSVDKSSLPQVAEIQKDRARLQSQVEAVNGALKKKENIAEENKALETELVEKRMRLAEPPISLTNSGLTAQEQAAPASETVSASKPQEAPQSAELQKDHDALKAHLAVVREFADESKATLEQNKMLKAQADELSKKLAQYKQQNETLTTQVIMNDKQSKVLQTVLASKEQDLAAAREAAREDEKAVTGLQIQLKDKIAQFDSLQRQFDAQSNKLSMLTTTKQSEVARLEKQLTDFKAMNRSTADASSKAQSELDRARQDLAEAKDQLKFVTRQKDSLAMQADSRDRQNKELLARLQDQLNQTRQQASLAENQALRVAMQKDDLAAQLNSRAQQDQIMQTAFGGDDGEALASVEPSAGDAGRHTGFKRRNSFLPDSGYDDDAPAPVHVNAPAARSSSASGDDWETVVVQ